MWGIKKEIRKIIKEAWRISSGFLVTGYWSLVSGCWFLVAGYWLLDSGFSMINLRNRHPAPCTGTFCPEALTLSSFNVKYKKHKIPVGRNSGFKHIACHL